MTRDEKIMSWLVCVIVLVVAVILVGAIVAGAADQAKRCTLAAAADTCAVSARSTSKGTIAIGGPTFTGTLVFEATTDDSNWAFLSATPSSGGSAATSVTGGQVVFTWTGAYSQVRVRASALSSGTVVVVLIATSG